MRCCQNRGTFKPTSKRLKDHTHKCPGKVTGCQFPPSQVPKAFSRVLSGAGRFLASTRTELNQTHERAQPANKWEPRIQPRPWLSFVGVPFKKGSCTFEGNPPNNPPGRLNRGLHFASKVVYDTICVAAAWMQCNHLLVCLTGTTTGIVDRSMAKWFRTSAPIKTLR